MNKRGFTLTELIITISIIGIILAVVIPSYRNSQDAKALSFGVYQIKDDIRAVQSYSNHLKMFDGVFPKGGYGIKFSSDSDSYIIFADIANLKTYDTTEEVEVVKLPKNVKTTNNGNNDLTIVFEPPYGKIYINQNIPVSDNEVEIKLPSGLTKTITITSSGALE